MKKKTNFIDKGYDMSQVKWKTIASDMIINEDHCKIRRDKIQFPDGNIDDYFISVRPDVVVVFAMIEEKRVLLVEQYKHAVGKITLELPAGEIISGESPIKAAQRELMEETGYVCRELIKIGKLLDDASKNSNFVHMFVGIEAKKISEQNLDPSEKNAGLKVQLISKDNLIKKIRSGTIDAQSSVACSLIAFDFLNIQK